MLVGREFELRKMEESWGKAKKGGRLLVILGPEGSGKGALAREFSKRVGVDYLQYRCEENEVRIPLGTLRRFCMVHAPELLVGNPGGNTLFNKLMKKLVDRGKVVVHIKNVHNADSVTLKFLINFATGTYPGVLVILTYPMDANRRDLSEVLENLVMNEYVDVLVTKNLSPEEIRPILEEYGVEENLDEIYGITRGNPEMTTFIARCWREGKRVRSEEEAFECLMNSLSEDERRILRIASTMGNLFWLEVLADMLGDVREESIEKLVERGIIRKFSAMYGKKRYSGYVFEYERFRDYIYSIIPEDERKKLHEEVARSIERRRIYVRWERIFELAKHYSIADDVMRAPKYLEASARIALREKDYHSASFYLLELERLLVRDRDLELLSRVYGKLMDSLSKIGEMKRSLSYGDRLRFLAVLRKAEVQRSSGNYRDAIKECRKVYRCRDPYLRMIAYGIEADCLRKLGFYREALKKERKHVEMADKIGNLHELATGYKNLGNVSLDMLNTDEAERYYLKARRIFRMIRDQKGVSAIYNNLGIVYSNRGMRERALDYYIKSLRIEEKLRDYEGMATAYNNIGTAYESLGEVNLALEAYRKSLEYHLLSGNLDGLNYAYGNLASLYLEIGNFKESLRYAKNHLEVAERMGSVRFRITAHLHLAEINYLLRKFDDAMDHARKALNIGRKHGDIYDSMEAYYLIAKIHHAMGDEEKCVEWAEKALEAYRQVGIESQASHVYSLLARCLGRGMLEEMERVVTITTPEDEYNLWMAKVIVLAKEEKDHWVYLERIKEGLKKHRKLATLVDFLEEYYAITGYDAVREEIESIKENFVYP